MGRKKMSILMFDKLLGICQTVGSKGIAGQDRNVCQDAGGRWEERNTQTDSF